MANEDINDLELGFLCPAVEVREKHLLGYDRALVLAEQFEQAIFLAGQVHRPIIDRYDTRYPLALESATQLRPGA